MTGAIEVAGLAVKLPAACAVRLLSDLGAAQAVREFVLASPDHTVYHMDPYFEHARRDDGSVCDLALILSEGMPAFALPLHRRPTGATTGYSGLVFPEKTNETGIKRSVETLARFFAANRHLEFDVIQSAQATAYEDPARMAFIARFLDELAITNGALYSRILPLAGLADLPDTRPGQYPAGQRLDPSSLENRVLAGYDSSLRSKVRQAVRKGLTIDHFWSATPHGTHEGYAVLQPLHMATWARSGITGHSLDYWLGLSSAISSVPGAVDLVTIVSDGDGNAMAGTICHLYRERAIYWSGCSLAEAKFNGANPLCLHATISFCGALGIRFFELGRFRAAETSEKERGVTQYKSQFGGELVRVVNFRTPADLPTRAGRRAKQLPLRVAARARRGVVSLAHRAAR